MRSVSLFLTKRKKVIHYFLQNAKNVWGFLKRCKKSLGIFISVLNIFTVFIKIYAEIHYVSLACVQNQSSKNGSISIVFQWFTLNFSSILIIKGKLKKLIDYKERTKHQTSTIYKNIRSKSCREFWMFSI